MLVKWAKCWLMVLWTGHRIHVGSWSGQAGLDWIGYQWRQPQTILSQTNIGSSRVLCLSRVTAQEMTMAFQMLLPASPSINPTENCSSAMSWGALPLSLWQIPKSIGELIQKLSCSMQFSLFLKVWLCDLLKKKKENQQNNIVLMCLHGDNCTFHCGFLPAFDVWLNMTAREAKIGWHLC